VGDDQGVGAARRPGHAAPGSGDGWSTRCGESGFANEAGHIERRGQDVGQDGDLGTVRQVEAGGAFDAAAGLVGVAAFGVAAAAHT